MSKFNVYEGDGNDGCAFSYEIEAPDLDAAVAKHVHMMDHAVRDHVEEDGDEDVAYVTVHEWKGMSALNGAAYYCAEIRPEEGDPRHR